MALNTVKCNHLTPLGLKGLIRLLGPADLGFRQSTHSLVVNSVLGCHYFPPRRWLLFQPQNVKIFEPELLS